MNCPNCGKPLAAGLKFCTGCGTPTTQPSPAAAQASWGTGPAAAPPPRRKSRAGKILLIVFGVFLLLAGGAAVAGYFGIRYFADALKSSEPYRLAEQTLRESPVAREALGEIKSVGFPLGTAQTRPDGEGHAGYTMSVEGARGGGQYVVMLERSGGAWRVVSASLRMSDGRAYDLLGEAGDGSSSVEIDPGGPPPPPAPFGETDLGTVEVTDAVEVGELDEAAQSKPAPPYPPVARAAQATGKVVVRVTVDESGRVIMASATSGHPLLRGAAVAAARQARFGPTVRGGRAVKAIGTLTYEFP